MSVFRAADYTYLDSMFVSKYYIWFCELGYPQLDIVEYPDGEWAIIEMENAPLMPSYTKHRVVFRGFRHMEPCRTLVKRLIEMIDLQRVEVMQAHEEKSKELEKQRDDIEQKRLDHWENVADAIVKNEDLKERLWKNGAQELRLDVLARRIPEHKLKDVIGVSRQIFT